MKIWPFNKLETRADLVIHRRVGCRYHRQRRRSDYGVRIRNRRARSLRGIG